MINFILPGLFENFELNKAFLKYLTDYPSHKRENVNIYGAFGNPQFCIWDGGRIFDAYHQETLEDIENILSFYDNQGITSRFVFTNNQLKNTDYYDRFCNLLLTVGENHKVDIVISDKNLQEYIHTNYPNYDFISSTTKCITNFENLKQEINDESYKMVCLDYNLNKNKKLLELTQEEKDKTEFLCNAICPPGCPNRKQHYKLNSLFGLSYGQIYRLRDCSIFCNTVNYEHSHNRNNIPIEEIIDCYEPNGFSYFKLEGRSLPSLEVACNYCLYILKPEYHFEFLTHFNSSYFKF